MKLSVEKIEEQFNLYFKGEKKLEAIKEWANKYDVYKEELAFSPNENKKEISFKFKSLGNELDSSTKNSHWGSFGIFWNLIKFFLK